MEEGSRHTQHRNESYAAGNYVLAWHANRILERYYPAYLDKRLPNGNNHRLRKHVLIELEQKGVSGDPGHYRSPVLRGRIWIRPRRGPFLAVLALVVATLVVASYWRR